MQVLARGNNISREAPAILALDDQIEGPVQLTIQPPHIASPVGLRLPATRQLNGNNILLGNQLSILTHADLGVLEQALEKVLLAAQGVADLELVLPGGGALAVVHADLLGDGALALPDLEVPLHAARRVGLEVDARDEGVVEPLLQPLLVEEEGRLERVQPPRQQRRPREDQPGADVVGRRGVRGERRRGLGATGDAAGRGCGCRLSGGGVEPRRSPGVAGCASGTQVGRC